MSQERRSHIESRIRGAALRLTPQRFAVLDYLQHSDGHLTADQIRSGINRRFPRASRATVYNALHALRDAGLVHEIFMDDAVARYDANTEAHHHFICRACGKLEDVAAETFGELPRYEHALGYRVESCQVVMRGVCAACGRRESKK